MKEPLVDLRARRHPPEPPQLKQLLVLLDALQGGQPVVALEHPDAQELLRPEAGRRTVLLVARQPDVAPLCVCVAQRPPP